MAVQVFDYEGQLTTWHWLVSEFGPLQHTAADAGDGLPVYRLTECHAIEGPSSLVVTVRWLDGSPQDRATVCRHWPDAPGLPGWTPPPERWFENAVHGKTNVNGDIGFGMGQGDYYFPPSMGASACWVAEPGAHSDLLNGLGMLGGTNHKHINMVFQRFEGDEPPGPGPGDDAYETIAQGLEMVAAGVRALAGGGTPGG